MNILMLTSDFPLGEEEHFPSLEIHHLSKRFERIFLVPTQWDTKDFSIKYSLPRNVEVLFEAALEIQSEVKKKGLWLRALGHPEFAHWLRDTLYMRGKSWRKWAGYLGVSVALKKALERRIDLQFIDVIYSYWCDETSVATAGVLHKHPHVVGLSRCHGFDLYSERYESKVLPLQSYVISALDKVCPISDDGMNYLLRKFPKMRNHISRHYLGIPKPIAVARSGDTFAFHILSVGSLVPIKRYSLIPEILTSTKSRINWTHFGGGPLLNDLKRACETLPSNVNFSLRGMVSHIEVLTFYRDHPIDLFLHVSESEGIPVSIMEAMAHGVPVLATDVGGTREIVSPDCGWLIPKNFNTLDVAGMIDQISKDDLTHMRSACRARFLDSFIDSTNYNRFCDEMIELVKAKRESITLK